MNDSHEDHQNAPFSKEDAIESACGVDSGIFKIRGSPEPIDIVDAAVVSDPRPDRKGRQGAALRRGTEKKRVRGFETRRRLIELHVFSGKRLPECARELGLSYGRTLAVWQGVVSEVHGSRGAPEEHLQSIRAYLDRHLRRVMEESQKLVGEAASYGAVVVAAGKALAELHGVKDEQTGQPATTLEDVGREVRVVSPLLLNRLDQIRELTGNKGDHSQSDAPALSLGGVPVEGSVQGAVGASGAKSPLLEGSAAERMLRGLEREGERAVQRAQLEGADVALEAMTVKRKPAESSKAQGCDSAGCSPSFPDEETEND
jgi:hypothetical protein